MNDLLEQIKTLSLNDKKTLSQKGLKLMEEAGELAKAILPYEGASGTNHRIPNRDKIAEECADSLLVAYSIMKSMDLTDEEIISIVQRKTNYWQLLQENENTDLDNLIFEFHVTVKEIPDLETFRADCAELGVKPIILELFTEGRPIKDMMTSSHFKGSTKAAIEHSRELAAKLREKGYDVVREKIETVPWHPASKHAHLRSHTEPYFEAHVAYPATISEEEKDLLVHRYGVRFSRNTMKKGDKALQMGTLRRKATIGKDKFEDLLHNLIADHEAPQVIENPVIEYALFDDNQTHDKKWISA